FSASTSVLRISTFTGNDIYQFSPFSFLTVEDMKEGNSIGGQDIDLDALASIKAFVFTKFNNLTSMAGGAKYEILSATDYSGTPDGFRDHYIGGDTQIVAKLVVEQYADVTQFGAVKDGVTNDTDSFMSAHNAVTKNQHVFIPSGEYRVALIDWTRPIVGDGCTLKPIDGMNQILKLGFHAEYTTWDFKPISGVTFDGTDESGAPKGSVGVSMLDDVEPQLSGRYSFVDCLFVNCTVGVQKPQGNIGNQFVRCTWTSNSYGMTAFGSSGY
uniref:hypothetical protein n=1 Tax=Serratia quinivorans TaxID=137545 RepID=UPI0035C6F2A1